MPSTSILINPPYTTRSVERNRRSSHLGGFRATDYKYAVSRKTYATPYTSFPASGGRILVSGRSATDAYVNSRRKPTNLSRVAKQLNLPQATVATYATRSANCDTLRLHARLCLSVATGSVFSFVTLCVLYGLLFRRFVMSGDVALLSLVVSFFFFMMTISAPKRI